MVVSSLLERRIDEAYRVVSACAASVLYMTGEAISLPSYPFSLHLPAIFSSVRYLPFPSSSSSFPFRPLPLALLSSPSASPKRRVVSECGASVTVSDGVSAQRACTAPLLRILAYNRRHVVWIMRRPLGPVAFNELAS